MLTRKLTTAENPRERIVRYSYKLKRKQSRNPRGGCYCLWVLRGRTVAWIATHVTTEKETVSDRVRCPLRRNGKSVLKENLGEEHALASTKASTDCFLSPLRQIEDLLSTIVVCVSKSFGACWSAYYTVRLYCP